MKLFLITITELVLGPIITIITIPLILLLSIINEIARIIVSDFLHTKYNGKVALVPDGADGIWGYKKPGSSRNVMALVSAKPGFFTRENTKWLFEDLLSNVKDSSGNRPYDKFKKILTTKYGYVCWKLDEHFDVGRHIRVLDEERIHSEADVMQHLSQFSEDMDETKPQWECIVVTRYIDKSNEEQSVVIVRFLHAYMDGLSFIMLFKQYWTTGFEYTIDPLKFKIPFRISLLLHLNTILYGPLLMLKMIYKKAHNKPWVLLKSTKHCKKNYAQCRNIDFETIRKIRLNNPGTTVTNVISTAFVTAAMKVLGKERLIKKIRVGELIAILPYPNSNLQNRFTNFSFEIPTCEESPLEKLRKCQKNSLRSLTGPQALLQYYAFKIFGRFPVFTLPMILNGAYDSLFLSNVPSAKKTVQIICPSGYADMIEMAAWPPQVNDTGITVCNVSYNGQLKVSGSADTSWLTGEELSRIFELIPDEIEEMADLCPFSKATWRLPEIIAQEKFFKSTIC